MTCFLSAHRALAACERLFLWLLFNTLLSSVKFMSSIFSLVSICVLECHQHGIVNYLFKSFTYHCTSSICKQYNFISKGFTIEVFSIFILRKESSNLVKSKQLPFAIFKKNQERRKDGGGRRLRLDVCSSFGFCKTAFNFAFFKLTLSMFSRG